MNDRAIFADALDFADPADRAEYLNQACAGDPGLRHRVEALLLEHDHLGSFMDRPVIFQNAAVACVPAAEGTGTVIGPYKLLEKIGEGGMGSVYMAEQTHPVRRKVALKVIKPGLDTAQVVVRFEAERQALALMDHPNIAKVFDGGTTGSEAEAQRGASHDSPRFASASGRPFFVMELVRGLPVTDYCDQARLPVRERLALFVQVCRAVQHAHQRGVIHRDLKPSNVLVTVIDGRPVPKVIDFGVAKATGTALTDRTLATGFHQLIGTPLYMSPEQAELSGVDVDTRSDVYALGVLLYELLTGTTPFDAETLRKAPFDDVRRMIREEEPAIPSRRLSTLAAERQSTVSERRGVDGRRLGRMLRGELDWVVMRALEKDRNRRYESAGALAADVDRYLADEPVEACPPTAWYRVSKYARRHRRLLTVAALFAVTLVAATLVAWRAERRAATEAAIARAVNDFLRYDLLRQVDNVQEDIGWTENPNLTVREALDRAAARIEDRFRDQPLVEAAIRATIGDAYYSVGDVLNGVAHLEPALALRRSHLGPDHPDTLDTMGRLSVAYSNSGRRSDEIALLERILETTRTLLGGENPATLDKMEWLAWSYMRAGQADKALALIEQVLATRTALLGPTHHQTLESMHAKSVFLHNLRRFDESLALSQRVFEACRAHLVPDDRLTINVMYERAIACCLAGKPDDAEPLMRDVLRYFLKRHGTLAATQIAMARSHLSFILLRLDQFAEAESLARQAEKTYESTLISLSGPNDWRTFHAMSLVGAALLGQGRTAEAEPLLAQGYEGMRQRFVTIGGLGRAYTPASLEPVVRLYEAAGQPDKAQEWREKLSAARWPAHGP